MHPARCFIHRLDYLAGIIVIAWLSALSASSLADDALPTNRAGVAYTLEVIADDLDQPWSLGFLPNGDLLVTELAGRLRLIRDGQLLAEPIEGVPQVFAKDQ
ncbi:MAG: PQQ-dependent sugar dehydrogenase, partial [Pseudomonadota bacterium]